MKEAPQLKEIATLLGITRQAVEKRAKRESWPSRPRAGRGGGLEYPYATLPEDVRVAIRTAEDAKALAALTSKAQDEVAVREREAAAVALASYAAAPEWSQRRAQARLEILRLLEIYLSSVRSGKCAAEVRFAGLYNDGKIVVPEDVRSEEGRVSVQTLRRWRDAYKKSGLSGLLSRHGGTRGQRVSIAPEIRAFIVAHIQETPHLRPVRMHELVVNGFPGRDLPSLASVYRYMADWKHDNAELYAMMRDPRKWKSQYLPAFGDAAADTPHFGHTWELDSTPADVITADGKRCVILGVIDVYSRCVRLLLASTSKATAVAAVFRIGLLDWGKCFRARMDNGKDYKSHHVTAICTAFSIETPNLRKYASEEKPFIERVFGTMTRDLCELLPGYAGHSVAERQALREKMTWASRIMQPGEPVACPLTFAELSDMLGRWVRRYESRPHDSLHGRTPLDVAQSSSVQPPRIRDPRILDILLAPVATPTVTKKGIALDRGRYIANELLDYIGQKVEVRRDLNDAGQIYVFARDNGRLRYVCTATDQALSGQALEEYIQAKKAKVRRIKQAVAAARTLSETIDSPATVLLPTGEITRAQASGKVVPFQAAADTPMIREAARVFEAPAPAARGLVAEMVAQPFEISRRQSEPDPANVVRVEFREDAPRQHPMFTKAIDAYDYLCRLEASEGELPPEDAEWRDSLAVMPAVRVVLELRADMAARQKFAEVF